MKDVNYKEVFAGDIVVTQESRPIWEDGGCGESISHACFYEVYKDDGRLMGRSLDFDKLEVPLSNLSSYGQAWSKEGFKLFKRKKEIAKWLEG